MYYLKPLKIIQTQYKISKNYFLKFRSEKLKPHRAFYFISFSLSFILKILSRSGLF